MHRQRHVVLCSLCSNTSYQDCANARQALPHCDRQCHRKAGVILFRPVSSPNRHLTYPLCDRYRIARQTIQHYQPKMRRPPIQTPCFSVHPHKTHHQNWRQSKTFPSPHHRTARTTTHRAPPHPKTTPSPPYPPDHYTISKVVRTPTSHHPSTTDHQHPSRHLHP